MTTKIIIVFGILALINEVALSQDQAKLPEPEYLSVFHRLDENGGLSPLERQAPVQKVRVKALGYGGAEGYFETKGERSPVRFKASENLAFVVLVSSQQVDPLSLIQFYLFEQQKGSRRLVVTKVGSMGINSKNTGNKAVVAFDVAKYGASSFKVVPTAELKPGEYCLSTAATAAAFCFGIDAPK